MNDNHVYPACTLIVGLPQETEEDVLRTIDLIDDLWDFRALLVPMFFVPLGHLKSRDWFRRDMLSQSQRGVLKRCLTHGIRQSKSMLSEFFDWEGTHTYAYRYTDPGAGLRLPRRRLEHERTLEPTQTSHRGPLNVHNSLPIPTIPVRE